MTTLKKNTIWNLVGSSAPLVAALFSIPFLLLNLGSEAFGVLTLIWVLIGYFSLFDFGIGRALTYEVGKRMPSSTRELSPFIKAGLLITLATGLIGSVLIILFASHLSDNWLKISPSLQKDSYISFLIASLGVIPISISNGLRGALEGLNRFASSNIYRLTSNILMFLLPVLSIYIHGPHLWLATLYMVLARLIIAVYGVFQLRHYLFDTSKLKTKHLSQLINYGVWIAVTGVISPLMVYGDRFFVSATVGAELLSQYSIPQDGMQRLLIIPVALCGAFMPKISAQDIADKIISYHKLFRMVALIMLVLCLASALLAYPILSIWISPEFASNAAPIAIILSIGIWFNSVSTVPYTFIHALGKPKITAIFHVIELVLYCIILWELTKYYGLIGAALAWVFRVILDFILLQTALKRLLKIN